MIVQQIHNTVLFKYLNASKCRTFLEKSWALKFSEQLFSCVSFAWAINYCVSILRLCIKRLSDKSTLKKPHWLTQFVLFNNIWQFFQKTLNLTTSYSTKCVFFFNFTWDYQVLTKLVRKHFFSIVGWTLYTFSVRDHHMYPSFTSLWDGGWVWIKTNAWSMKQVSSPSLDDMKRSEIHGVTL